MEQVSRIRHIPYKLFIFVLYAENHVDYVRRQVNRYIIETKPACIRFGLSITELRNAFKSLQRAGYIYNLTCECGRLRFYVNLPKYLTFNQLATETEKYVAERKVTKNGT